MNDSYADLVRKRTATLWADAAALSARKIALFSLAGGLLFGVVKILFVGESVPTGLALAVGMPLGAVSVAFVVAPLVGLLGWLTRGTFNMRPLFVAILAQTLLFILAKEVFVPLAFRPLLGLPFYILVPLLLGIGTTLTSFASLMTLVSHRFSYGMLRLALVLGVSSTYGAYKTYLKPGREGFMSAVFAERSASLANAMDSRRYPSSVIESDFKAMSTSFRDGR